VLFSAGFREQEQNNRARTRMGIIMMRVKCAY
jgi:hypothetical protein